MMAHMLAHKMFVFFGSIAIGYMLCVVAKK